MTKITYIPGEIANAAIDEHGNRKPVTRTHHIFDDNLGKPQSQVNQERIEAENTLDGKIATEKQRAEVVEGGLNTRLQTVEQLAEISIGGGDAQIATGADFTNPDATKRAKVPTVGAIVDGLNDGVYDVSKRNPTAGPNSDGKFTLDYILDNADTLIPTGWRHGGMTISFVQSSDNKYVQYMCKSSTWSSTPTDWEKINNDNRIKNIEDNIIVGDFIPLDFTTIEGLRVASTKINTQSAGENLHYLPCIANVPVTLKWNIGEGGFNIGVCATTPALNVAVTQYKGRAYPMYASGTYTFTPEIDGYVVFSYIAATGNYGFAIREKSSGIGYDVYILQQDRTTILSDIANIKSTLNNQEGDILDLQRNIYEDEETISPDVTTLDNIICGETAGFVTNNSYYTKYIKVWKGLKFKVTTNYSCYFGYSANEPAIGVTQGISGWTNQQTVLDNEEFISNITGYFFISINNVKTCSFAIPNADSIAYRVAKLEEGAGGASLDDKVIAPSVIYDLFKNNGFNAINRIYTDGIYKNYNNTNIGTLRIGGKANKVVVELYDQSTREYTKTAVLSAKGYEDKTITIPVRRGKVTDAQNKSIRIMCIGDSLTIGGYPAIVDYIFKRLGDEYENISALMVGHLAINADVEYNEISKSCRGCCEGVGGMGISSFLRHVFMVRPGGTTISRSLIAGKTAWDTLGLGTKTRNGVPAQAYETYTGSTAQNELIRTTCHGWYDAEPTEEVWTYLYTYCELRTFTVDNVQYTLNSTFATTDASAITAGMKYLCTNNDGNWPTRRIVWYDYDTVQSSNGAYAFNFGKYLDKYKTLADDGVTRLVVGSTAGTLVTNVNSYDVCKPNFVSIMMAQNDVAFYLNPSGVVADVCLMADLIKAYDSNIQVSFGGNRMYGSMAKEEYQDEYVTSGVGPYQPYLAQFYELLKEETNHADILNTYQLQTVIGSHIDYADSLDGEDIMVENTGDNWTHSTLKYYLDRAYQVVAWVIYKLGA